jgi:hypothetical protein
MLINVSTRKFRRSVRLPGGDVGSLPGDGTSKSAVSRKFVALSNAKLRDWLACDLSTLDLLAIQIDGLHISDELILVAAVGIDGRGEKHPLGLVEGATENAATVQALLDNLVERGLDPAGVWLFIIDGAKALSKAIRRTFGQDTPIQRCQVHKARNITERLPKSLHAAVRKTLRQAWELDDAAKAEQLVRNLARRLEKDWPGISATILEGLEEILCVVRLGLPQDLRRSLACGVDDWRGGSRSRGVAVDRPLSRCAGASFRAMAPFPVAARQTGRADLPHPAFTCVIKPSRSAGRRDGAARRIGRASRRGTRPGIGGTRCLLVRCVSPTIVEAAVAHTSARPCRPVELAPG